MYKIEPKPSLLRLQTTRVSTKSDKSVTFDSSPRKSIDKKEILKKNIKEALIPGEGLLHLKKSETLCVGMNNRKNVKISPHRQSKHVFTVAPSFKFRGTF